MSTPAIRITNLSKSYRIQRDDTPRATNIGEAISRKVRGPFKKTPTETFWALKDIDLEIKRGEVVGVIGRNGAGKSTLLKVLSRITEPTTGRIELYGRVGSLLEVGTGFHPELTGRENIFLNGAILGMKRGEIKKQFDAIVDFAGVEKFLDTPVKRYSSGMYVRLAFAVAAHLNPEILIVDEVLAVGDAEFQKKCLGKMQDVAQSGRTVLFVSHNSAAISQLTQRAVMLKNGTVDTFSPTREVLTRYVTAKDAEALGTKTSILAGIEITSEPGSDSIYPESRIKVRLRAKPDLRGLEAPSIGIGISNDSGDRVTTIGTIFSSSELPSLEPGAVVDCVTEPCRLRPGSYRLRIVIQNQHGETLECIEDAGGFEVLASDYFGNGKMPADWQGPMLTNSAWKS